MQILTRTEGPLEIVNASGRATMETHALLRRTFKTALDCGRRSFVLNLSQASALDSLTLGELVACLKRAREAGGDMALVVAVGSDVHEVLQITGLERVFRIYGSQEEATAGAPS